VAFFVINEWLWADSSGDNGKDAQSEAFKVIRRLPTSDHQIVVTEGSAFDQKAWALCKSRDMIVSELTRTYVVNVRLNSDRCMLLKPDAVLPLPEQLALAINCDDHYLVRGQLSVPGSVLVTTDGALREVVTKARLPCLWRDEFLAEYFPGKA